MFKNLSAAMLALVLGAGAGMADELRDGNIVLYEQFEGTRLAFEAEGWPKEASGVTISVEGPDNGKRKGAYSALVETGKEVPRIDLGKHGDVIDGLYVYEISGATGEKIKIDKPVDNGRNKPRDFELVTFSLGGKFLVDGRRIIVFQQETEKGRDKPTEGEPGDAGDGGDEKYEPTVNRPDETKDDDGAFE